MAATGAEGRKPAILGALTLYLDFINLFLMLLRLLGNLGRYVHRHQRDRLLLPKSSLSLLFYDGEGTPSSLLPQGEGGRRPVRGQGRQGVQFEKNKRYRIDFTASSDRIDT